MQKEKKMEALLVQIPKQKIKRKKKIVLRENKKSFHIS